MAKISKILLVISLLMLILSCVTAGTIGNIKTGGFDGTLFLIYFLALGLAFISVFVFLFSFLAASICIAGENEFKGKNKILIILKIFQIIAIIALMLLAKRFFYNPYELLEIGIILYLLFSVIGLFTSIPLIFKMKGTGIKISDAIILYIASACPVLDLMLMVLVYTKENGSV